VDQRRSSPAPQRRRLGGISNLYRRQECSAPRRSSPPSHALCRLPVGAGDPYLARSNPDHTAYRTRTGRLHRLFDPFSASAFLYPHCTSRSPARRRLTSSHNSQIHAILRLRIFRIRIFTDRLSSLFGTEKRRAGACYTCTPGGRDQSNSDLSHS
jgi:hypothetical protein